MYSFLNDYSESAHPNVLKALVDTNMEQLEGYGFDEHCQAATARIKEKLACQNVDVHFLTGGTQVNHVAAAAFLTAIDGVVCADTAHIHVHETGSVEASGHKLIVFPNENGKLTPAHLLAALAENAQEHTPRARMVYISNTTETGSIYTKAELQALHTICKANDMLLFIDGARLGSALAYAPANLTFADLPTLCDAFYIGGTKNGALFGEALVVVNDTLKPNFRRHMKQRGAILAKGKVLGAQFNALFEGDLYMQLARHANAMADMLREGIAAKGYSFQYESFSNQIFPIFPDEVLEKIGQQFVYGLPVPVAPGQTGVRLVTSWATDKAQVQAFLNLLAGC
ncbi:aminotransferase class I/II-fold pyridoxal phosphate-dependent enzyme [Ruminococcaceae bacterium OttesenSCG-928-N02]|nr:aminotransferase class I/II-fold pyridoxal phosphate-dependent enzyme [Ruminococcaceae bacterium OttesenSCG-928-N02]